MHLLHGRRRSVALLVFLLLPLPALAQELIERYGGVKWTIKSGRVYDAEALLSDVRLMVHQDKERLGIPPGPMRWVDQEQP